MKIGLYLHIPFCLRRCTYCDFNTYAGLLTLRPAYVEALEKEIASWASRYADLEAVTLYFGGGTPSVLDPRHVARIIAAVRHSLTLAERAEVTLEANPGTVDATSLLELRRAGVTRLSLGVQSADNSELAMLGRIHTWEDAVAAVRAARQAGFDNLSLDLLLGLPGQTLPDLERTLEKTLALEPEHLSLYALKLEPGTPLATSVRLGELPEPDPDLAADMYEWASDYLCQAGFWQYEISNWARGRVSAPSVWALPPDGLTEHISPWVAHHNLIYWRNQPWLGAGAGAYSWLAGHRWSNLAHPRAYIKAAEARHTWAAEEEVISRALEIGETMMMGLRLAEGVSAKTFHARFGVGLEAIYGEVISRLSALGLLAWDKTRVRLTAKGRLLGNQVFAEFLP